MYIAGIYELLNVAYTGNKSWTLGTLIRKSKVKTILKKFGFLTPEHQIIDVLQEITLNKNLKFPLIVKPSREDASVGINNLSIVNNLEELRKQAEYVFGLVKQPILIEEYIEGRELNVAILGNEDAQVLPISEIDFSKLPTKLPKIVTYSAKWHEESDEYKGTNGVCPAILDQETEQKLKSIALQVYSLFDCCGYIRVDFRLSKDNLPYILEVNPNPDISIDAGFFRSAKNAGYTYSGMLRKIVELGFESKTKLL
jgi:D-alanine-D-alanine ligase